MLIMVCLVLLNFSQLIYRSQRKYNRTVVLHQEIERSRIAYALVFERIGEVLFSRDVQNHVFISISANCELIFGYTQTEFMHDKYLWLKIIHPDDRYMIEPGYIQLEAGKSVINQYRVICKDGSIKWIENNVVPTIATAKLLVRLDGVTRDITEKKLVELEREQLISELIRHNKAFEHFGYVVSHQLRVPVANIMGLNKLLQTQGNLSDELQQVTERLGHSVADLDHKIRELNQILTKEQVIVEDEDVNFNELQKEFKL